MTNHWRCPYCDHDQIISRSNFHASFRELEVGRTTMGTAGIKVQAIRCANVECNQLMLSCTLHESIDVPREMPKPGKMLEHWVLKPESLARPQPDYIPQVIREDYSEACLIRDKSPKASATLARRCLQGMIRDFCSISKNRLIDEIKELRKQIEAGSGPRGVEPEHVDAIDAVRQIGNIGAHIGNIGAHMEKDIGLIVDVDPGEAQALIELIEMLFAEWYVARHRRAERLARVTAIASDKDAKKAEIAQEKKAALPAPDATPKTALGGD